MLRSLFFRHPATSHKYCEEAGTNAHFGGFIGLLITIIKISIINPIYNKVHLCFKPCKVSISLRLSYAGTQVQLC